MRSASTGTSGETANVSEEDIQARSRELIQGEEGSILHTGAARHHGSL